MQRRSRISVILNVYDLIPKYNDYGWHVGIGAFHSGVEILGLEYSFGGHEYEATGVFTVAPRCAPGVKFRESIHMGETDRSLDEVRKIISTLSDEFMGNSYNLFSRNCNNFSEALCQRLLGKSIPSYVNRLAWMGGFFQCLLPEGALTARAPTAITNDPHNVLEPPPPSFSGEGYRLTAAASSSSSSSSSSVSSSVSVITSQDDTRSRRELLLAAAVRRSATTTTNE